MSRKDFPVLNAISFWRTPKKYVFFNYERFKNLRGSKIALVRIEHTKLYVEKVSGNNHYYDFMFEKLYLKDSEFMIDAFDELEKQLADIV